MYNFAFQRVLDYRNTVVENIQKDIGKLNEKIGEEKKSLKSILNKIKIYEKKINEKIKKINKAYQISLYVDFIESLLIQLENIKIEIQNLEKLKIKKQNELLTANKNKKILEELKKSKIEKYNMLLNKKEQETFDDIAIIKYHKKNNP